MQLDLELRLEDRSMDRVFVSVVLVPRQDDGVALDGVSLQLTARGGEPLGPRMLLPISGTLAQPMMTTVELRATGELPQGAQVVATAWCGTSQREASLPTDPTTQLEAHMRGDRPLPRDEGDRVLEVLLTDERAHLVEVFPWIARPVVPAPELELVDQEDELGDLVDELGLDDESAEWLKDLMAEEL